MGNLNHIIELYNDNQFLEVIKEIEKIEDIAHDYIHPELLLIKANSIELCEEENEYTLEDVEKILKKAISLDKGYTNSYIELAYYYLNVLDKPVEAKEYFFKAHNLNLEQNSKIVSGITNTITIYITTESVFYPVRPLTLKKSFTDPIRIEGIREGIAKFTVSRNIPQTTLIDFLNYGNFFRISDEHVQSREN